MAELENVFMTTAFEYTRTRFPLAGFFCLWDDEVTFVASKWVQFVTMPLHLRSAPGRVKPTGPEDPRTRFRLPYAELTRVTKAKDKVRFHPPGGKDRAFGGGIGNTGFRFEAVAAELAKALEAAGYIVEIADGVLSVQHEPG